MSRQRIIQQRITNNQLSKFSTQNLTDLQPMAWVDLLAGRYETARATFAWALEAGQLSGYRLVCISALHGLGCVDLVEELYESARAHFEATLQIAWETGRLPWEGSARVGLGQSALGLGERDTARNHFCAALHILTQTQATPIKLEGLTGMAQWLAGEGEIERARELLELVLSHPAATYQTRRWVHQVSETYRMGLAIDDRVPPVDFEQAPPIDPAIQQLLVEFVK